MIDINIKEAKDNLQKFIENILTTNKGNFRVRPPTYDMSHWRISIVKVHRLFEFRINNKNPQHIDIQEIVHGEDPDSVDYGKTVIIEDITTITSGKDILELFGPPEKVMINRSELSLEISTMIDDWLEGMTMDINSDIHNKVRDLQKNIEDRITGEYK